MTDHTSIPPFASDTLPLADFDHDERTRLMYEGRRIASPMVMEDGSFYFPQVGKFQLFQTPQGHRIIVLAQDPDDLELEEITVDETLAKTLKTTDEKGQEVPVPVGTKLPFRIKDKGDGNLDRLLVVGIRSSHSHEKWFRLAMYAFSDALLAFKEAYGTLSKKPDKLWVSDGVIYKAVPAANPNNPNEYDIIMTASPGHGSRFGQEYEVMFKGISGYFMRHASVRARNIPEDKIEEVIERDFDKRSNLLMEGMDVYRYVLNGDDRKKPTLGYRLRKTQMGFAMALGKLKAGQVGKNFGAVALGNLVLAGLMYTIGIPVSPLVAAGKIFGQTASKTGKIIFDFMKLRKAHFEDTSIEGLYKLYCQDHNELQFWGSRLNKSALPYLRALNHDELNTDLALHEVLYKTMPTKLAALEYIFGTTQGPVGTIYSGFKVGSYGGFRSKEPNGLGVEYIPEMDCCYARLDWNHVNRERLPGGVIDLFARNTEKPFIKVWYDRKSRELHHKQMTAAEYKADFETIGQKPYPPSIVKADDIKLVGMKHKVKKGLIERFKEEGVAETTSDTITKGVTDGLKDVTKKVIEALPSGPVMK